jgi:hypothetical protein
LRRGYVRYGYEGEVVGEVDEEKYLTRVLEVVM